MKKLFMVTLLGIFLIFQSCHVLKRSDDFYGIQKSVNNTVYLIDISGSMEGVDEGNIKDQVMREVGNQTGRVVEKTVGGKLGSILGRQTAKQATKLGAVKRNLIPAIKGLPDGKLFTVFAFENDVKAHTSKFVVASNITRTSANLFVESLKAGGGTDTLEGLKRSLATPGIQEIILMSDGLPNDDPQTVLDEVERLNSNNVVINTIAFGEDADHDFMRKLAEQNGGQFVTSKM